MVGRAHRTRCANWLLAPFFSSRSDSSFNFFVFFFIFFAQDVVFVLQAIGIPGWGFSGWIVSLSALKLNTGVAVLMMLVATQFTAVAGLGIIMLKRVRSWLNQEQSFHTKLLIFLNPITTPSAMPRWRLPFQRPHRVADIQTEEEKLLLSIPRKRRSFWKRVKSLFSCISAERRAVVRPQKGQRGRLASRIPSLETIFEEEEEEVVLEELASLPPDVPTDGEEEDKEEEEEEEEEEVEEEQREEKEEEKEKGEEEEEEEEEEEQLSHFYHFVLNMLDI
nr:neurofilament light polypeptide-like [Anolis sagrei ordinatus]